MSKKNEKQSLAPEQIEAERAAEQRSTTPVTDLIVAFIKKVVPAARHEAVERGARTILGEQDGFVRNGNRQDYKRDAEAFTSARMEPVEGGFILNYSTMKTRRLHDVVREVALHIAREVFPATPQKNGKLNSHKKEREGWVASLGFQKDDTVRRFYFKRDGADELLAQIALLIPETFEGTKQPPKPNKASMSVIMGAGAFMGRNMAVNLYDPSVVGVEDYGDDFKAVEIAFTTGEWTGWANAAHPVAVAYDALLAASKAEKAKQEQAAVAAA